MKIYIVVHKQSDLPIDKSNKDYIPIQVGAAFHPVISEDWILDNTMTNISNRNKSYNELTALYWIWKNSNENIVGLCHYRRYFVNKRGKALNLLFGKQGGFINEKYISKLLIKHDMIVHNKTFFKLNNAEQFKSMKKYPNDIEIMRGVLAKFSSEYVESFDYVMNSKHAHLLNMLITRKEILDSYCEWLFDILFRFENTLKELGETNFERRIGMMAERMLDVWIVKNNINYQECFTINTERKDWRFFS